VLRKRDDGELHLAAVVEGDGSVGDRVARMREACGWNLQVDRGVREVPAPSSSEILALRNFDRERVYLS
jgi:hypothetical protein